MALRPEIRRVADLVAQMDNAPEDEHELAAVPGHLATNRHRIGTIGDVLDRLDRNEALSPFIELTRSRLL